MNVTLLLEDLSLENNKHPDEKPKIKIMRGENVKC
jgi:hypothetical protein